MLSWGARRRIIYTTLATVAAVGLIVYFAVQTLYRPPTCSDGKQNQDELGVDCGGVCSRLCERQFVAIKEPLWKRMFEVTPGIYNAVAYIENPNAGAGIQNISYSFKLYDDSNILLADRVGSAFIPARRLSPIFEGTISTGSRRPARIEFTFESPQEWTVIATKEPELYVSEQLLKSKNETPLLTARITNQSKTPVRAVDVVAILYDSANNARAASKTVIDSLAPASSRVVSFSWPVAFSFNVNRVEIVPRLYPGSQY